MEMQRNDWCIFKENGVAAVILNGNQIKGA